MYVLVAKRLLVGYLSEDRETGQKGHKRKDPAKIGIVGQSAIGSDF